MDAAPPAHREVDQERKMTKVSFSAFFTLMIFLAVLHRSVNELTLTLDATYYHVRVTTEQLQEENKYTVLTIAFSRPLLEGEVIEDSAIVGQNVKFELNSSTLTVHPISSVSPGRHSMDIAVVIGSHLLSAPLTVDVIAEVGESCHLQPFGKCSHFCTEDNSSEMGYTCSCEMGYNLQLDGFACLVNDPMPLLLFSDSTGIHSFSKLFKQSALLISNNSISLFDFSYHNKALCYVLEDQSIMFASLKSHENGQVFELYRLDSGVIGGLVYDWINDAVIFSNIDLGMIVKISLSNKEIEVIFSSIQKPRKLAIQGNTTEQQLLWIEGEASLSSIKVVKISTGEVSMLVENLEDEPLDIDMDIVNGILYWITVNGRLKSYSALKTETICDFEDSPTLLTVFESFAYVVVQRNQSILRVDLLKPNGHSLQFHTVNSSITDVSIYHPLKQPLSNNGRLALSCSDCEQLCLISSSGIQCDCYAGYRLSLDGRSCYPSDPFQLFLTSSVNVDDSRRGIVVSSSLDGVQQAQIVDSSFGTQQSPITGLIFALEFDIASNSVFFGDRNSSTLWIVSINRLTNLQDDRVQLAKNVHAWGMAYDWIHKTLYWTDDRNMSIGKMQISKAQTNDTETVISGLRSPRGIAVDPVNEWLYWIETGETPTVSRQKLNGQSYQILIDTNITKPSGLTIDFLTGTLYWGDIGRIEEIDLLNLNRTTHFIAPDIVPFQLTTIREFVAFTINDRTKYCLFEVDTNLLSMITLQSSNSDNFLYGITALSQSKEPTEGLHSCYFNSLNCSHFCNTDSNDNPSCGCPVDYQLQGNQATCSYEVVCPLCGNGGTCSAYGRDLSCSCAAGFTGDTCTEECPPNTFGVNCIQQCKCVNGTCNSLDGSCQCFPQYSGELCNEPICSPTCQNGGNCIAPDLCLCQETYSGPSCETRVCTSDYCFNGGTCFVDFEVDLSCRCPTNVFGPQCQFNNEISFNLLSGSELGAAIGVPISLVLLLLLLTVAVIVTVHYVKLCRKTTQR